MIKLAYTYATPDTQAENILAYRGKPREVFATLHQLGYQGVELMVRDPKHLDPVMYQQLGEEFNLEIAAVSTGQLRKEDGLNLSDLDEANRQKTLVRMKEIILFGAALKAQVNIGSLRGVLPKEGEQKAKEKALDSFRELLNFAAPHQVQIAVEPQNRYITNWLQTIPETLLWQSQFEAPHFRILFDVYHGLLEERSLYESMILGREAISHIQFSDSNRGIPGSGQLDFPEIIRVLKALDYQGFISVEARQSPDSYTVAQASATYLLPYLDHETPITP